VHKAILKKIPKKVRMKHPFDVLVDPFSVNGYKVEIDKKLVPLIKALWARNIPTFMSCQDINEECWISFFGDKNSFMNIVNTILDRTKYPVTISRSGNTFSCFDIRFPKECLPQITKLFQKEGLK